VTYRAELNTRALRQMHGLPVPAFDSLIQAMAEVIDYPTIRSGPSRPATPTSGAWSSVTLA
jgi:hypothetical protein